MNMLHYVGQPHSACETVLYLQIFIHLVVFVAREIKIRCLWENHTENKVAFIIGIRKM